MDDIVIYYNFCFFVCYVCYFGGIYCEVIVVIVDVGSVFVILFDECRCFDNDVNIVMMFLILINEDVKDFNCYFDIFVIVEKMLSDWGYVGIY